MGNLHLLGTPVLRRMGAEVSVRADATTVRGTGELRGLTVNMRDISDTMPTLAAIAPFASAQKSPDETRKSLQVAEGLEVSVFAAEPMFANPCDMDVDSKGDRPGLDRDPPGGRSLGRHPRHDVRRPPHRHVLRGHRPSGAGNLVRRPRMRTQDFPRFP